MATNISDAVTAAVDGVLNDPDGKRSAGAYDPSDTEELRAFIHYIVKGALTELLNDASIIAGIEVEDGTGKLIGTTRASRNGVIE